MPYSPIWTDIGLCLLLTFIAGGVLGFDREATGHPAGLRTTILVALAAAIAMVQCNLLLSLGGKNSGSFAVMDLMRLPLGILTGVGFIGGGAILRRNDIITGITSAATLWIATVIGLCFGGGQLELGAVSTLLAAITLWVVKLVDVRIPREQHATLEIVASARPSSASKFAELVEPLGFRADFYRQAHYRDANDARLCFQVSWKRPEAAGIPQDLLAAINGHYLLLDIELAAPARHRI